jgi:hypothetical protein
MTIAAPHVTACRLGSMAGMSGTPALVAAASGVPQKADPHSSVIGLFSCGPLSDSRGTASNGRIVGQFDCGDAGTMPVPPQTAQECFPVPAHSLQSPV